jgi:hypothetical protein
VAFGLIYVRRGFVLLMTLQITDEERRIVMFKTFADIEGRIKIFSAFAFADNKNIRNY